MRKEGTAAWVAHYHPELVVYVVFTWVLCSLWVLTDVSGLGSTINRITFNRLLPALSQSCCGSTPSPAPGALGTGVVTVPIGGSWYLIIV